eukprot:CAMPEP_0202815690 /NCGR_PEP_ID=MMETSP1389-20130828/6416_1 /ASSEMBLY_ACC=CAM_ASM_000865 /TAXON_ID=302021 /ORGANISM="Rhodomonas sp., Strain CCMP768" /LENGTH=32 /DNA_ID= /DNA_START= /DNA_END= /DNA_ORIENTATION=
MSARETGKVTPRRRPTRSRAKLKSGDTTEEKR